MIEIQKYITTISRPALTSGAGRAICQKTDKKSASSLTIL